MAANGGDGGGGAGGVPANANGARNGGGKCTAGKPTAAAAKLAKQMQTATAAEGSWLTMDKRSMTGDDDDDDDVRTPDGRPAQQKWSARQGKH